VPPASARYWSWLFAAPAARAPLLGLYALMAEWRALTVPSSETSAAHLKLAWWQEEIQRLGRGTPVHPISRYLGALLRAAAVDFNLLNSAVEAAARQIAGAPLEHGAELEAHGGAVWANPLILAAQLADRMTPESERAVHRAASALGAAEYLSDALRSYRHDARCGRVPFPIDELLAAGIENSDLTAVEPPHHLQSYLADVRNRTRQGFAASAALLPREEHARQRHLLILANLGGAHLTELDGRMARLRDLYRAWSTARRAVRPT
jgi:phytoene synthase